MALSDLILKAKVNMALIRDPRVGSLDIGVRADDGIVTLTGDVDEEDECYAASEVAGSVDGVKSVRNEMTCGLGRKADTAEEVSQRFLEKLDDAWNRLPDNNALTQADYLRWALWMVYKFRIPENIGGEDHATLVADTTEKALTQIAGCVGGSKALVALEMLRQAEAVSDSPHREAPETATSSLVATPVVEGQAEAA